MKTSRVENIYNDEKLLLYVFNYRTFINEHTINITDDIQELNLINTVNTRVKALNSIQDKIEKYEKSGHGLVEDNKKTENETKKKLPIRSRIIASEEGLKKILSIDKTLEKYGKYSASQLVDITHKESTPWTKAGAVISQFQEISDELILKFHQYETI